MNASHVLLCMMLQKNDMSCGFGEEASKWTDGHLVGIYLFVCLSGKLIACSGRLWEEPTEKGIHTSYFLYDCSCVITLSVCFFPVTSQY